MTVRLIISFGFSKLCNFKPFNQIKRLEEALTRIVGSTLSMGSLARLHQFLGSLAPHGYGDPQIRYALEQWQDILAMRST